MDNRPITTREICIVAIFTAITAVLSQIVITLPFTPIPISLGIMAVFICGILLSPKCAALTQLCYVLLGAVGLPVFSYFRGGIQHLAGPTGGYLFAYPLLAWIISMSLNRKQDSAMQGLALTPALYLRTGVTLVIGTAALYTCGTLWMCYISQITVLQAATLAVFPYIPLDIVKIVLCTVGVLPVRQRLGKMQLMA